VAAVLEGVGVSAYIGAAALISTKAYLTAAASILSIEAKHNGFLREALGSRPFPQPFDAPLSANRVFTLAKQFIVSCPANNPPFLPLSAFPLLGVTSMGPITTGKQITLTIMPSQTATKRSVAGEEDWELEEPAHKPTRRSNDKKHAGKGKKPKHPKTEHTPTKRADAEEEDWELEQASHKLAKRDGEEDWEELEHRLPRRSNDKKHAGKGKKPKHPKTEHTPTKRADAEEEDWELEQASHKLAKRDGEEDWEELEQPTHKSIKRLDWEDPSTPCCDAVFAAFAAAGGSIIVPAAPVGNSKKVFTVNIPEGIHGQSYVVLTNSATDDDDSKVIAGPAIIEVLGASGPIVRDD
jgi:hypothetical protein